MTIQCTKCHSEEVMTGEPSVNEAGQETITHVCLDCGHAWEVEAE